MLTTPRPIDTGRNEDDRRNLAEYAREFDQAKAGAALPTLEDLLVFMDSDPQTWTEALHRVLYLARGRHDLIKDSQLTEETAPEWVHMSLDQAFGDFFTRPVFVACTLWDATGRNPGTHPLAPLLTAWFDRPQPVQPDRRTTGIIPGSAKVRGIVPTSGQQALALGELNALPRLGLTQYPDTQTRLPGIAPTDDAMIVPPPLQLYDLTTLPANSGGRGAPLTMRAQLEFFMAVPLAQRGKVVRLKVHGRELISWLWPNGNFRPNKHLGPLGEALTNLSRIFLPWTGGAWFPTRVVNIPTHADDWLLVDVELPPGSGQGPLVHRPTLRGYGLHSAPAYRAYLAATYQWDEYLTNAGHIVQATRPVVKRDDDSNILDRNGQRILGKNGQPVRRWNHPKAVRLGEREDNPAAARFAPLLTRDDIISMANPGGTDRSRQAFRDARKALEMMAADGVITLETGLKNAGGQECMRVLPPPGWGPRWRAV